MRNDLVKRLDALENRNAPENVKVIFVLWAAISDKPDEPIAFQADGLTIERSKSESYDEFYDRAESEFMKLQKPVVLAFAEYSN
jgi:hypothetical protein